MSFTIRLCPFCGGDISSEETGYYVCEDCGKRTFRSRSNDKAFLLNKPYEEGYSKILGLIDAAPKKGLEEIDAVIVDTEEPNPDMFFTRGLLYTALGEEGKAHNDWKRGLELLDDVRWIDAYIIPICKRVMELICMKERDFITFDPVEYLDTISTEFGIKAGVPCRGIFYITLYRNFRMKYQSGGMEGQEDVYHSIIRTIIRRILAYGRNFRTNVSIIEEVLEDFHYDPDTYLEDDELLLHLWSTLRQKYLELSKDFSDEHLVRIFRHWNDQNMFDMEYWVDQLMDSVKDDSILQKLRSLGSENREKYDLETAAEDFVRKSLLLSADGEDLSEEA